MAKTQAEVRAAKDAALAKHDNNKSSPTHQSSRSKIGQQTISAASSRSNTASYSGSSGSMSNGKFTVTGPVQRYSSAPTQEEKNRRKNDYFESNYGYKTRSFGKDTYDSEAFDSARDTFMDWMTNTGTKGGANNKKYGYDWSDPEDVARFNNRQVSKKYEASYSNDPLDQWLKANGQASADFFNSTYYRNAYSTVMSDRIEKQKARDFKNAVVREAWSTANDPMNITDEEMVAAYQRVKRSNPIYDSIEIYNPKDNDTDFSDYASPLLAEQAAQEESEIKRAGKLDISEIWGDLEALQKQQTYYETRDEALAQKASTQKADMAQSIINDAISKSGYSTAAEKRTYQERESRYDGYAENQRLKQIASDNAVAALREAGYATADIEAAMARDGRLSYKETSEGKQEEKTRKAREASMRWIIPASDAEVIRKAQRIANNAGMLYGAPISQRTDAAWVGANTLSAEEQAQLGMFMGTTRARLETEGYDGLEIDNYFRRHDLGEYIPQDVAQANAFDYTMRQWGFSDEDIQAQAAAMTEDDWANFRSDMERADYYQNSTIDQIGFTMASIPARAAYTIASNIVGFTDMLMANTFQGDREKMWPATEWLQDKAAYWQAVGHDQSHEFLSLASDYGSEIVRMFAVNGIGKLAGAAVSGISAASKGTSALMGWGAKAASSAPFIFSAAGGYFTEAMQSGASVSDATRYAVIAGTTEGLLEKLSMGEFVQGHFGSNLIGKKLMNGNTSGMVKQLFGKYGAQLADVLAASVGEGMEEGVSYIVSSLARCGTWDESYQLNSKEFGENFLGGFIIGGIMGGLSAPANSQRYKYAMDIYNKTGSYTMNMDSLYAASYFEQLPEGQRNALQAKYEAGDIVADKATRQAAIDAEAKRANIDREIAAKKKAVESAENDADIKVKNTSNKVTQAEQRLASIDDPDPVKKGKKITQASRELSAAKAAKEQAISEGQKKVDSAKADYTAIANKRQAEVVALDEIIANYQAAKYFSDFNTAVSPAVSPAAVEPTANTNVDANTAQNGIDNIKNGVAQTANEKYNNNRGDINGAENGNQAQAGGNAGISGQTVTVPYSGMAQGLPGMDRRADYRGIGSPVKDIIRQQGATPVDLRTASDPSSFYAAISEAKQGNPHGAFVTAHDVSEYGDMKMFLGDDNGVGVAVTKDGDIVSVFKNPNISKSRKAVSSILLTAIDNGGVKLDNYNGELSRMYLAHGFIPVARTAFVDEYAPSDWNYERDGRPDIIFWMHNGNDVETVARNIGTQEMPDLKALPLMEYDEAAAYRDGLITKNASANSTLKDLGANTPTPAKLKQSKMYTNTYDKWLTDAEKAADSVENSVYAVSKESDSIAMAKERVRASIDRTGGIDEAIHDLAHGSWDAPDVDTAMLIGETLRAEAAETGDYTKLNDWKQEIQRHMTESGQAIQALAKWTRDSSIGAETALDKAVADINKQNQKRIDKGKMAPIEVNPELLAELNNTQTRAERDAVMNKIAADIGSKMPSGILDKFRAWRYLSMLGNPRTVLRNLIGNEIMSDVLWTSKDAVGAALEKVMGVEQSQRTKALAFGDAYKANKAYAATTLDDARTALEDSSRYDTKSGIERAIDENRQIFKFKPVEKWREATNWALSEGDTVFLEKQYKRSFAQIMTARGYTPDTMTAKQRSECMSYAINEAKRSTFHDANSLADAMTKIENKNLATKILVGGTVPFKKTPLNVLARGVEFSPIGLIQGTGQMLTDVKAGKMDASTAIDKMSSGLVGSSLMALGYFLAKSGVISGGDNDEDKYYQSDLGKQEYALNLPGGSSMTIDWAAPASIPLFMGVALQELIDGSGGSDEAQSVGDHIDAFLGTLSSITDPLVEMSMLQGLQDTLEAVANARSDGNSLIGAALVTAGRGYASQFVPTIGGQIARTIDPVRRDTAGDPTSELGKDLDKTTNKMQAKMPGLASNLQPYVNIWGEQEINEHSWPVRLLEQTILPGYLDEVDMTPVDVELTRLYSVTQDPSVVPSNYLSHRTLKSGDERYVLTADEYTEFKIENGRAMYAAAEDAINSSQYSRMSDDEKASYVAKAIKDAQYDILKRYKKKYLGK